MKLIPPYIPPGADILVIGEAAGRVEEARGRQFVGESGQLLFDHILKPAGIHRERCATANVVPLRPPNNSLARLEELGISVDTFVPELWECIGSRPWKMIIPVGDLAFSTITNHRGVTQWHGSLLNIPYRCVPLIHPAAIIRQWDWFEWTKMDAQKIKFILDNDIECPPDRALWTFYEWPDASKMIEFVEGLHRAPFVAFDIETYKGTITALSLAGGEGEAVSIPFTDRFADGDQRELIKIVRSLLSSHTPKCAQNGSYDITYLREWGCEIHSFWLDTMLGHHSIHPELPHSLAFMCNQYTLQPFYKDMRKETDSTNYSTSAWQYSALDACVTWEVARKIGSELCKTRVWPFYASHVALLFGAVCRMQLRGIRVDESARKRHMEEYTAKINTLNAELGVLVWDGFNANSHVQVKNLLYNKWELPAPLDRKTGVPTSNETALRTLLRKFGHRTGVSEVLRKILSVRETVKLRSFLKAEIEQDGRMRTFYNISGTTTGRLSSGENIWGRGTNLQNIPRELRDIFVADDGFVLWQADGMQAEDRVVAYLSGEPVLINAYAKGMDTHAIMAQILFGVPYEHVVAGKKAGDPTMTLYRDAAKRIRHGWNYGMGAGRMTEVIQNELPNLGWTRQKSDAAFAALADGLPFVVKWRREGTFWLKTHRIWFSPYGRRRKFTGRTGHDLEKEFYANAPQGMVGDHINSCIAPIEAGLHRLYDDIAKMGYTVEEDRRLGMPLLQVHDSIVGQCRPEWLGNVKEVVERVMQKPLPLEHDGVPLVIPCDFKSGPTWRDV